MNREGSKRHWKLYPLRIAGYVLLFVVMVVLYFFFKSYVVASLVWLLVLLPSYPIVELENDPISYSAHICLAAESHSRGGEPFYV